MRFATASMALVATASTALAGKAIVVNQCDFDAQLVSVGDSTGPVQHLPANGGRYEEEYKTRSTGGMSLKVSKSGGDDVAQFEYTFIPANQPYSGLFWDLSLIDGNPIFGKQVAIVPQVNGGGDTTDCKTVTCTPGTDCPGAYMKSKDDWATHHCPADTDLTYYLCNNGQGGSSGSSGSSGNSAPASSPTPSPAPAPSPAPSPSPSPKPSPSPVAAPAPSSAAPQQFNQKPADTPAPAPQKQKSSGYALQVKQGSNKVVEVPVEKRDHANHIERHNRIRRMHHARTVA